MLNSEYEIDEDDKAMLISKYKVRSLVKNLRSDLVILCNTQELQCTREELDPTIGSDKYLFASFMIRREMKYGENIIVEAWGLTRIIPWPDSIAFKLL
jgi:hypothetical protein